MNLSEAYRRLDAWPDHTSCYVAPCVIGCSYYPQELDTYPSTMLAMLVLANAVETAESDEDLRAGLARFLEQGRAGLYPDGVLHQVFKHLNRILGIDPALVN